MVRLNHHYQKLSGDYLFPEIDKKVAALKTKNPNVPLINLGIGDVTIPLSPTVTSALSKASIEMGEKATFRGYGPSQGYLFLREAIASGDYHRSISPDEIFISNGAKCDLSHLQEIFATDNRVALPDPTYPVYLDTNVMAGRTRLPLKTGRFGGITYLSCTEENGFQPEPPNTHSDLIYLCSPNNPTGVAMTRDLLKRWVQYAKEHQAIILFDGAYEAFVTSPDVPRSIYEIEGAKEVAIEVRSYSKTAGFSGLRCSYTVIPHELKVLDAGRTHSLHALWKRRCDTKFNGVPYPVQKAAAALYTPQGLLESKKTIETYLKGAAFLKQELENLGLTVYGGTDAPYLWCKTPLKLTSWEFFDRLLDKAHLITVPGKGFGMLGDGFIRLSAFADISLLKEAISRLKSMPI
jgi:LL-diaminopimelate aminotransferase